AARSLALTGAFAGWLAEEIEEAARQVHAAVKYLGCPRAWGQSRQFGRGPRRPVDRVVEHLGRQSASYRVGIVQVVALVPLIGDDGELVRPGLADGLDQLLDVEVALDEVPGQSVEQGGIGRRVAGADVVHRLDDADAGQVTPHAVDVAPREVRVVFR